MKILNGVQLVVQRSSAREVSVESTKSKTKLRSAMPSATMRNSSTTSTSRMTETEERDRNKNPSATMPNSSTTSTSRMTETEERDRNKNLPQHLSNRPIYSNVIVNDDDNDNAEDNEHDDDDDKSFDFRPFPDDENSCMMSDIVSFDDTFERSILSMLPPEPQSTAVPQIIEGDEENTSSVSPVLDISSEADDDNSVDRDDNDEEEDCPTEVSEESNSIHADNNDDDISVNQVEEDDDEDVPADVSVESNSVYSGGESCSDSCESNRIEFIQLEENDESLTDLTLDCQSMDEELASEIFVHLRSNTHLKVLRLKCGGRHYLGSSNDTPHQEEESFCKIVSALKHNTSIEQLEINGAITINRCVSSALATSLAHNSRIQIILMDQCKFVGASLAILFVAMQHLKQIRQLGFHSCDWEEHNAETVASSLPYLNLHSLSLVGMNIASEAWPYLFRNILHSKNLVQLDLSRNTLEESDVRLLVKSLTMSKNSIKTLCLAHCGLTHPCAKEFLGLREYHSLTSLDISHNPRLADKSAIYFKDLIKCNRSITKLHVQNCNLSQYSLNAIDSGLRYNNSILKSFLSEKTSMAIFEVVDIIGKFDMLDAVPSFGGSGFARLEKEEEEEDEKKPTAPRLMKHTGENGTENSIN
jgi:hypothetical protein